MQTLHLKLPDATWTALTERSARDGESVHHVVRAAIAAYLEIEHHTLYQVSVSNALIEGVYQGAVTVGRLREHGDLGLGTFDGVDGEMVVVDGEVFQVRADGSVRRASDDVSSPFAAVVRFEPDSTLRLSCDDLGGLQQQLDTVRSSGNVFYAVRVDGVFGHVHTRALCRSDEGVPLVVAAAHQPEFHLRDVAGTMVGFWSPDYVRTLEVPGYHLHFVSAARDAGGHVLDCSGRDLTVSLQRVHDLRVALPASEHFLHADLTHDPARDLARIESKRSD
jgi:acetolactate decarboxylase